ncbi:Uma2 family endonuclease [Oscillatoria sp. FACHB-1406]|uniref:Uma2 family endonuclease n=1 Tax=Oscillatoria sp. FACHB-1406 TaxID=2692846 RepID=UPI00168507F7|nr:Uma2 family endonuclease [Oscillatoria sp. FACHB-1406]MBD2579709.1 Uma2 family endonuclease [Oscillatoria sp. FACHB-1406]
MVQEFLVSDDYYVPDAEQLITEDDTPVDNWASEKQQRLLAGALYSNPPQQTFLAAANVGIYYADGEPAIVPDVFVSLDVSVPENWWEKQNRVYMMWRFGKSPEVAIEIVSNKVGEELGEKKRIYELMRVSYYIVYDPARQLSDRILRIFELRGRRYTETSATWLEQVELGVCLWEGEFENRHDVWLRWCDRAGNVLPTGDELARTAQQQRAEAEQQRAEAEQQRAEAEQQRAEAEQQRAEAEERAARAEEQTRRLLEQLRAAGIEPDPTN